jgi:hypothetical protein
MTSIEWLQDKWGNEKIWTWEKIEEWFEKAKEMHKQEIMDAYDLGSLSDMQYPNPKTVIKNGEQYYQQTFKKD